MPENLAQQTAADHDGPGWLGVCVDLSGRNCLIAGGGRVAERRCQQLLSAGATVRVVAPRISPAIVAGPAHCAQRPFAESDLDDIDWVVVATDDSRLNQRIAELARSRRIWVNAAHKADEGNLIFPATVRRGQLQINVSTGGRAPALGRYLAHEIGVRYGARWELVTAVVAAWRKRIGEALGSHGRAGGFWHRLLRSDFVEMLLCGQRRGAEAWLREALESELSQSTPARGCVYLVGAGPGDQRLLTLRAFEVLQKADIVLYDRLVSAQVLACIPGNAEKISVGKERQRHELGQESINELMVGQALSGRTVVRLKGGDPFIFGRGGEEIEELARRGVRFQVIPGISAANGCACYYGIPLTHRDYAHSCLLMTAHRRAGGGEIDWAALAQPGQTLVLYMGNYRLPELAARLVENGFCGTHPIALISAGTTEQEKIWVGHLSEVIECPPELPGPTLAIVGDVVRLTSSLNWRATRPDAG